MPFLPLLTLTALLSASNGMAEAVREWAGDPKSSIARLDKGFAEAKVKGWTVVDMKNDWKPNYL